MLLNAGSCFYCTHICLELLINRLLNLEIFCSMYTVLSVSHVNSVFQHKSFCLYHMLMQYFNIIILLHQYNQMSLIYKILQNYDICYTIFFKVKTNFWMITPPSLPPSRVCRLNICTGDFQDVQEIYRI